MEKIEENNGELLNIIKSLQDKISKLEKKNKKSKSYKNRKIVKIVKEDNINRIPVLPHKTVPTGHVGFTKNLWTDDGSLCKSDKVFDQEHGDKFIISERVRTEVQKITVKCALCDKAQKINPGYVASPKYWVCPSCVKH